MKTIFVSGASGVVGYGILKSLRSADRGFRLIGSSIYSDSVAPAFCDKFLLAPKTLEKGYLKWLKSIIKKYEIDLIIPGIEIDLYTWFDHAEDIRAVGAELLLNSPRLIHLCRDKWCFYQALLSAQMPSLIASSLSANFLALEAELGLPFIVKPRQGFGSRGIRIIETENDFAAIKSQMGDFLMAQRLIGSSEDEYTIAVFGDGNGDIATEIALRRTLSLEGFTEKAEVVFDHPFSSILSLLCSFFKPTGPTNFQFRLHEREPKLLEINPRLSSSTSIRTAFGYNESLMAVDFKLNGLLPFQPNIKGGKAVRYAEEKIFYE